MMSPRVAATGPPRCSQRVRAADPHHRVRPPFRRRSRRRHRRVRTASSVGPAGVAACRASRRRSRSSGATRSRPASQHPPGWPKQTLPFHQPCTAGLPSSTTWTSVKWRRIFFGLLRHQGRQDHRPEPLPLASDRVTALVIDPRRNHLNRPRRRDNLPRLGVTVTHHQAPAPPVTRVCQLRRIGVDLGLQRWAASAAPPHERPHPGARHHHAAARPRGPADLAGVLDGLIGHRGPSTSG